MTPKITVIVPTMPGREKYLRHCLRTCVEQDDADLEILVSDNAGSARDLVAGFNDPRVRYIRTDRPLPMSEHWEFALAHATGDVVSIIGDDDGLMPGCIARVRQIIREHGMLPIRQAFANYRWPDYADIGARNTIEFPIPATGRTETIRSVDYLRRLCGRHAGYLDGPTIYHGFIPASLIGAMKRGGSFFRHPVPDVYSAIAIAAAAPRFLLTSEYLTLSGQGAKSTGSSIHRGRDYFAEHGYRMRFASRAVQILLYDALLEVERQYGLPVSLREVNLRRFVSAAAVEIMRMPRGLHQIRQALALAGFIIGHRALPSLPKSKPLGLPQTLGLPGAIQNIWDASLALHAMSPN